jgi:hypothetical protein
MLDEDSDSVKSVTHLSGILAQNLPSCSSHWHNEHVLCRVMIFKFVWNTVKQAILLFTQINVLSVIVVNAVTTKSLPNMSCFVGVSRLYRLDQTRSIGCESVDILSARKSATRSPAINA